MKEISYSCHLSKGGHAITNRTKLNAVSKHNQRKYSSKDGSENVCLKGSNSIYKDVKEMYEKEFGECLKKYNDTQKRKDRKIEDYFKHISDSRADLAAEIIIEIGDMEFWKDRDKWDKKGITDFYADQLDALEKRMPAFKVASAVIHFDEKSPHMHIVGVPVATGYENGMEKQCAKTKIFTKDSLEYLQNKMREEADRYFSKHGEPLRIKEKQKGRNYDLPKEALGEFYALKRDIETLKEQKKTLKKEIEGIKEVTQELKKGFVELERRLFWLRSREDSEERARAIETEGRAIYERSISAIDAGDLEALRAAQKALTALEKDTEDDFGLEV